jgi:hypothetical protein
MISIYAHGYTLQIKPLRDRVCMSFDRSIFSGKEEEEEAAIT